jgi:integrase
MKLAKVKYRNPYQTRHTYASMMLTAGESDRWVAAQMGHTDTGMINRIYGKWIVDAQPDAGSKAVELFAKKQEENAGKKLAFCAVHLTALISASLLSAQS